jgi:hypothetical protein
MVKGIKVEDVLLGLSTEERKDFAKRISSQAGVDIRLTVPTKTQKRKRKWFVQGKVIGVRVSNEEYQRLKSLADNYHQPQTRKLNPLTLSEYCGKVLKSEAGRRR